MAKAALDWAESELDSTAEHAARFTPCEGMRNPVTEKVTTRYPNGELA
jgi:hypothetical protein